MQSIISEQAAYDSTEATTLEITSEEDEVVTVDVAPKRKYRLSHRKSSDGNDRDVLVLKNIGWKEETLKLEVWTEDLSPAQLEIRNKSRSEIEDINTRLDKLLKETTSEVIFEGDNTALYEFEKEVREKPRNVQPTNSILQASKNNNPSGFQLVMDPRSGVVVGTMTPAPPVISASTKPQTRKRTRASTNLSPIPPPPAKVAKPNPPPLPAAPPPVQQRPTEATAVGGLSHGSSPSNAPVVDLTSDDGRSLADSREISFNKLQGKTFPSLVVVARPHLRIKDSGGLERGKLDSKVKAVLMHAPTKFTEWLIQQGLIRSEQSCTAHSQSKLKLGMYSDVSKFPFSGGYVWISECCPQRFVSVFSGSLFEGSPHPPSVILKLIYHWACQTNVQNVVQWVKVDNLYVKGLNTWLRATCTVALHTHLAPLGGPGKKVEVGVISLGTTSQDGHQRQVKVEVLGLLETEAKLIRLRAVEPLSDGDRNYKKRFSKILEPLLHWVHPDSTIVTDLTVDKVTLYAMGFKYVMQTTSTDGVNNHTIMEYLRRIVPRMFQNTLSLLSRQIIQQFLDELVWREWFGNTAAAAFDNIVLHLADQTRIDTGQSLLSRLNKVAGNPFKNWSIKHYLNYQTSKPQTNINSTPAATSTVSTDSATQKRITKRKVTFKAPSPTPDVSRPVKSVSPDIPEQMVPLEHYYYGSIEGTIQCPFCLKSTSVYSNGRMVPQNLSFFLQHLYKHQKKSYPKKCPKCALWFVQKDIIKDHLAKMHTTQRRKAGLVPWPVPRVTIMVPKSRQEEPIEEENVDISNVIISVQDNLKCRECSLNLTSSNHFPALLFCSNNNCQYSTCCRHAMNKHTTDCRVFHSTLPVQRLPFRMYCVCGYNDTDGNLMAKHLTVCERKSAYPSEQAAKSATVTHSMLDVLGLVRRPEEPITTNEVMEIDSDDDKNSDARIKHSSRKQNRSKVAEALDDVRKASPDQDQDSTESINSEANHAINEVIENLNDNDGQELSKSTADNHDDDSQNTEISLENERLNKDEKTDQNQKQKAEEEKQVNTNASIQKNIENENVEEMDVEHQDNFYGNSIQSNENGGYRHNLNSNRREKREKVISAAEKNSEIESEITNEHQNTKSEEVISNAEENDNESMEVDCNEKTKNILHNEQETSEMNDVAETVQ
ncbi:hypothetical protein Trydic_g22577 [Trypoxylus dichotomus]